MNTKEQIRANYELNGLNNALYLKNDRINELENALRYLLQSYKADFKTITGANLNDTDAVITAKKALKIPTK